MEETQKRKKVALIFWGLTRGLKYTKNSINENIINVLIQNGYDYEIFLHTYFFKGTYSNIRHGIHNMKLDFNEYKILNPQNVLIDDQDRVKETLNLEEYRNQADHFKNNYESNDNYIISLYSQMQVTRLFEQKKKQFHYCIFLRPDVIFEDKLDIKWLRQLRDGEMVIPANDSVRYKSDLISVNDRFCICKPNDAYKYGEVFRYLLEYSKNTSIIAETFLGHILKEKFSIKVKLIIYYFKRVLPNGQINHLDANKQKK